MELNRIVVIGDGLDKVVKEVSGNTSPDESSREVHVFPLVVDQSPEQIWRHVFDTVTDLKSVDLFVFVAVGLISWRQIVSASRSARRGKVVFVTKDDEHDFKHNAVRRATHGNAPVLFLSSDGIPVGEALHRFLQNLKREGMISFE
jgi:hypothetical protein